MKRGTVLTLIIAVYLNIFIFLSSTVSAQEAWETYESNCCTIQYLDASHLNTFTLRIGGFRYTSSGLDDNPSNVKTRVDEIMEKVQATLDMYPSDFHISILLYPDYQSIETIFRQFTLTGQVPLAFYAN